MPFPKESSQSTANTGVKAEAAICFGSLIKKAPGDSNILHHSLLSARLLLKSRIPEGVVAGWQIAEQGNQLLRYLGCRELLQGRCRRAKEKGQRTLATGQNHEEINLGFVQRHGKQTSPVHVCAGPDPRVQGKHALNPRNKPWLKCVLNVSLVGTEPSWCFGLGTETWSTRITIKRCLGYLQRLALAVPVALKRKLCFTNI